MLADEDLPKILGRVRAELLHAEVLEDEQVDARELLHEIAAVASRVRLGEVGRQVERAAHERARLTNNFLVKAKITGGESGIRTLTGPLTSISYRFYRAIVPTEPMVPRAHCTGCTD